MDTKPFKKDLEELITREIPDFIETIKNAEEENIDVILHQDAFAADYQYEEFFLLGAAIKYAGLHGRTLHIIGTNRETLKK